MTSFPTSTPSLTISLALGSQSIIDAKQVIKVGDEAKDRFKELMPQDCRRMDYDLGGNLKGHWIRVTRTRSGTVSCSHFHLRRKNA